MAEAGTNPYLALLQQQDTGPTWAQVLQNIGNLGFGLAGGFGQAAATGQPTMAGIGPGLMMGNQMNAQAAQAAEQDRLKRAEIGLKAQEYEDKRGDLKRKQDALAAYLKDPGFNAAAPTPSLMGPQLPTPLTPQGSGYDSRVAGAEGGTRNGGMVFNELGSGAFGPYQFMPATWAAVRVQNPSLNLPEDMTQATREQHDAAHGAFKAGNAQGLQAAGFQPTPDNLYLAHRFGLGGATSVLRADPDKPLAEVLPIDWQRQNPDMRGQTAGGFRRLAAERVGGVGVPYVVRPDAKPVQYSGPVIEQGDSASNQPSAAMTPVVPQPKWETPGDVMPVNPSAWFSTPAPPALPAVPVPGGPPPPPPAPGTPAPGGPNVVQPQYAPQPGQPTMAPGGGPAPGGANPPPVFVPPAQVPLPPEFNAHVNRLVATELITPAAGEKMKQDYSTELNKQVHESARAQYQAQVEVWKQREQVAVEQRKIQAQVEAEQRAAAQEQRRHERGQQEEGDWVRIGGVQTFVPKKDIKAGMTKEDAPPTPPSPGTPAGDDHILSTAPPNSVEYRDAYERKAGTPHVVNGQTYVPDMRGVPAPTYGQAGNQPPPAAGPAAAPAGPRSDVPGKIPVGEKNYTGEQTKEHSFVTQLNGAIPQLEDLVRGKDGSYTTENLPGNFGRVVGSFPFAPEVIVPDKVKELRRIEREIVSATLRQVSGATIKAEEYRDEASKYIPQSGDPPEVVANKLAALKRFSVSMAEGTGRPLDKYPNIKGYAESGGAPAPAQAVPPAQALQDAKNAIMKGAPRAKVIERLKSMGIDTEGL